MEWGKSISCDNVESLVTQLREEESFNLYHNHLIINGLIVNEPQHQQIYHEAIPIHKSSPDSMDRFIYVIMDKTTFASSCSIVMMGNEWIHPVPMLFAIKKNLSK